MQRQAHKALYYGVQLLRGRPVGALLRRLRKWDALDPAAYRELAAQRLAETLDYARRNVPLYASNRWTDTLRGAGADIRRWPVLERRDLVDQRAALVAARDPWRWPNMTRRSSASTGTPVSIAWNPLGVAWSWAAEYHPMVWHGLEIGVKTLRLWGTARALENWVLNRYFVPAFALTTVELERARRYLATARPQLVWGLPSAVAELARYVARNPTGLRRRLVPFAKIGGEQVYPFQRQEIRRELGARVIEAYGCTEVGPIAAECPAGALHVLSANVHLEIFRGDTPVPAGELGDIVVTTLVNRAMPLVRCRVGDSGRLSPEPCVCALPQPVLAELRGRSADLLLAVDGTPVHASVLGHALQRYSDKPPLGAVRQILFEQLDPQHWRVRVEAAGSAESVPLHGQVDELLRETFGAGCAAEIEVVAMIPREPSGKYRYYRPSIARPRLH